MLLGKPNTLKEYESLDIKNATIIKGVDISTLLVSLAEQQCLLWVDGYPVYADDIRADYINKELYAPIFKQDIINAEDKLITYNNRVERVILHSYKSGFESRFILVQPDVQSNTVQILNLANQKLMRELHPEERKAKDLFERYIAYSYGYHNSEIDFFKFEEIKASNISKYQREFLKRNNLKFYGAYAELDYRDVRRWSLTDLRKQYNENDLKLGSCYGYRRLNFELELYMRILSKEYWEEWTLGTINDLLSDKRDYLKYKENGIYLIFKKEWLRR